MDAVAVLWLPPTKIASATVLFVRILFLIENHDRRLSLARASIDRSPYTVTSAALPMTASAVLSLCAYASPTALTAWFGSLILRMNLSSLFCIKTPRNASVIGLVICFSAVFNALPIGFVSQDCHLPCWTENNCVTRIEFTPTVESASTVSEPGAPMAPAMTVPSTRAVLVDSVQLIATLVPLPLLSLPAAVKLPPACTEKKFTFSAIRFTSRAVTMALSRISVCESEWAEPMATLMDDDEGGRKALKSRAGAAAASVTDGSAALEIIVLLTRASRLTVSTASTVTPSSRITLLNASDRAYATPFFAKVVTVASEIASASRTTSLAASRKTPPPRMISLVAVETRPLTGMGRSKSPPCLTRRNR